MAAFPRSYFFFLKKSSRFRRIVNQQLLFLECLKRHICLATCVLSLCSQVQLFATSWTIAHQAPLSWDSPGKNTGVGFHALLMFAHIISKIHVSSKREVQ